MSSLLEVLEAGAPPIEEVALAIAADAYPHLEAARYVRLLDELAAPLGPLLAAARSERQRRAIFTDYVYGTLGFHGNTGDYYDPRNSYLNDVIDRRTGIPITLAVVLMALGRRAGLRVEGVGFPGHFLARVGGPDGELLDPFSDGNVVEPAELAQIAGRLFDARALASVLEPVDCRAMAVRMLFNLQHIHERRGDHAQALVVCDRLVDLAGAPFHRRDRGLHALALGAITAAIADLEAYLASHPEADDRDRIAVVLEGARARAAGPVN